MIRVLRNNHINIARFVHEGRAEGFKNARRRMSGQAKEKSSSLSKPLIQLLIGGSLAAGAGYAYSKYSESQSNQNEEEVVQPAPGLTVSGSIPAKTAQSDAKKENDTPQSSEVTQESKGSTTSLDGSGPEDAVKPSGMSSSKLAATITVPLIFLVAAWLILNRK